MSKYHQFVDFINKLLVLKGWKPIDLSKAMKVDQGQITKLLKSKTEKCDPTLNTLDKLAKALDISVHKLTPYFVHSEDEDETPPDGETGERPDFPSEEFFGRSNEIAELVEYCDRNKLIFITGLAGMGKSTVVKHLQHLVSDKFDDVVPLNLNFNPAIASIDNIIAILKQKRCLLILDNLDLEDQEHSQNYHHLLEQIAKTEHKSCTIVTCRTLPEGYRTWEPRPKIMALPGLAEPESIKLLENGGLPSGAKVEQVQALIQKYGGNPWGLKLAMQDIDDLYDGDLAAYLEHKSILVKGFRDEIEGILKRLSLLELEVLYWLALQKEPLHLNDIRTAFPDLYKFSLDGNDIRDAVLELYRRSLLEKYNGHFSLVPAIQDFVGIRLLKEIRHEIEAINSNNFEHLVWLQKLQLKDEQIKLRDRLTRSFSKQELSEASSQVECISRESKKDKIGYILENLRYLSLEYIN